MRRDLGQLSLAGGLVEGGAGRTAAGGIAAPVGRAAFERLSGDVYAAPARRRFLA